MEISLYPILIFTALLATIVFQWWIVSIYVSRFVKAEVKSTVRMVRQSGNNDSRFQPKATIVLCLRGADPFLEDCFQALLDQNYSDYEVLCVLDSKSDPAWEVLRKFRSEERVRAIVAEPTIDSCSLKNNSLVEAFQHIADECQVVVLVDADAVVDRNWLIDLVEPLENTDVVASSGNRWFGPKGKVGSESGNSGFENRKDARQIGTRVRMLWNLAAAPQMLLYQIAWGGSLALNKNFAIESKLVESWKTSLFDDTQVKKFAREQGKRVVVLPNLLVPNREEVSINGAHNWLTRQLLDVKLYHGSFALVVAHCFGIGGLLLASVFLFIGLLFLGNFVGAMAIGLALLLYALFYIVTWHKLNHLALNALRARSYEVPKSPSIFQFPFLSVLITQWAYTRAVLAALTTRQVSWRGIEYDVRGPFDVKRTNYVPMIDEHHDQRSKHSI